MPLSQEEVARLSKIGPAAARLELASSDVHGTRPDSVHKREVRAWIEAEDARLSAEAEARSETRASEALSIAREANRIAASASLSARRANIIAIIAAVFATAAAIIAAVIGVIYQAPKP